MQKRSDSVRGHMAQSKKDARKEIVHYTHADKERLNNPPIGLVTPDTDHDAGKKTYVYDPHLDPQLQIRV
jgi:adenine-specific DNA-methyltransferase